MDPLDDPQLKLAQLAAELATTNPARAEELTRSVTDMELREPNLAADARRISTTPSALPSSS